MAQSAVGLYIGTVYYTLRLCHTSQVDQTVVQLSLAHS